MKVLIALSLMLSIIAAGSCGGSSSTGPNSNTVANAAPQQQPSNPKWPYPDWAPDPSAALQKPGPKVFHAGKVTDVDLSIPSDWVNLGERESTILLRSPVSGPEDSPFANLGIQLDNMKPVMGMPAMDQKRHFDYSTYEPAAAYKDYLQKKNNDPIFGRTQQIAIDGVWGVLEQSVSETYTPANVPPKGPNASWIWTTFFKLKSDTVKFEIFMNYPVAEMDTYKAVIAGLVNTVKIKRAPGVIMLETQPQ